MANRKKTGEKVMTPFLRGAIYDRTCVRSAFRLMGSFVLIAVMSFLVSSVSGVDHVLIRLVMNIAVILLILYIFLHLGLSRGVADVKHGEILYKRKTQGQEIDENELKECFHKGKGFLIALTALIPFILLAVFLSLTAKKQMTGIGALPQWITGYLRRSEVSAPLSAYMNPTGITASDMLRIAVRICIMPFINLFSPDSANSVLIVEKISPLILLLYVLAYGAGYTGGVSERMKVHSEIRENRKRAIKNQKKAQRIKIGKGTEEQKPLN